MTVLGVTIGLTSKAEVEARLGKASISEVGHGDEAEDVACYRSQSKHDDTIIAFYFGALGGWVDVTRISVSNARAYPLDVENCESNRQVSRNVEFLRKLRLGSTVAEVIRALGAPSHSSAKRLSYYTSHKCGSRLPESRKSEAKSTANSPCELVDSVDARFTSDGKLEYVSFYHFVEK